MKSQSPDDEVTLSKSIDNKMDDHIDSDETIRDEEFQFDKSGEDLEQYIEDIADTVRIGLDQSIAILTPWFFNNMPRMYYRTTPRAEKVRHLSAVITGHVFETKQTVELWDHSHTKVTYIGPGSDNQILISMAKKLTSLQIKMGSIYFSRDKLLFLATFFCKDHINVDLKNKHLKDKIEKAKKLLLEEFPNFKKEIQEFIQDLDGDFVVYATPMRIVLTFRMYHHMYHHEGAHSFLEAFEDSSSGRLTLGFKGVETSQVLEHILGLTVRYGFEIVRFFSVRFAHNKPQPINVLQLILSQKSGEKINKDQVNVIKLIKAIRTLGWVDIDDYNTFMNVPYELSISAANLIRAISSWVHILLGKENVYYYSEYKILKTFSTYPELSVDLANLFRVKFSPIKEQERKDGQYEALKSKLTSKIEELIDRVERHIFREAVHFIENVLKTNYFIHTKTGLAFRLDPKILDEKHYPQIPFGIFYVVGKDYRFFQIRWKDVARGGLRVVMPRGNADYSVAISGLFDEVYGLSHAQQLKNKDIPEGGSKAVLALKPNGSKERAVKGAINALLDLLVSEDESHEEKSSGQVSYYQAEEIIYLGPDENMTNDLIEWVPQHAKKRNYQYAEAFMSSKPKAGINHKEFGVTSEGLHVFVDQTLKFLGIDPKMQSFTVKMTGGPDGDVAGNELNILYREYGENARVVAIADGFGAAYDPTGLDWKELLRLFKEGHSICHFDETHLTQGSGAFVIKADSLEHIRKRNELHGTAKADIFIPAGGRPYTVNGSNYKKFISDDGAISCRAIVEGANIFFTKEARDRLMEAGILMIKDSSANKTGVICSSFEIIASLVLDEEEFAKIKKTYVSEVIDILRTKALAEAKLLFREFARRQKKVNLVTLSMQVSREINVVTDTLLDKFTKDPDTYLARKDMQSIILHHCPKCLRENYETRIFERLPKPHQIAIIAAAIASHIVYKEGLGWLESITEGHRFRAAMTYMENDQKSFALQAEVKKLNLKNSDQIIDILRKSAARELTMSDLETKSEK